MVAGGDVPEERRIDRPGYGELAATGRFTDLGSEVLEATGCGDLQRPEGFVGADEEGVRPTDRQQDEVARAGVEHLLVAEEPRGTREDVERLVLVLMAVQGRGEAGRIDELDHG